jgi:riboflavin-specific deaminase-like protein
VELNASAWGRLLQLAYGGQDEPDLSAAGQIYGPLARRTGRPFVLAQIGQSLDGRIATPSGDARDISGPGGLDHLHRCRALMDAVVIGVGTAIADDPSLTVRRVEGRSPVRVVIDPRGRLPATAKLLHDGGPQVVVIRGEGAPDCAGAETLRLPGGPEFSPADILVLLTARGLNHLLVEGGGVTIGRFLTSGLIDRLHVAVAPILIGSGPAGIRLPEIETLSDVLRPVVSSFNLGSDVLFDCDFGRTDLRS